MSLPPILQQFDGLDKSSTQFPDQLIDLFSKEEYKSFLLDLHDENAAVWFIEYLDTALDALDSVGSASRECRRQLGTICSMSEKLPRSHVLDITSLVPVSSRSLCEPQVNVYEGLLNGSKVCVKRLSVAPGMRMQGFRKVVYRNAPKWKRMKHQNIVQFQGITQEPLKFVSAWTSGIKLNEYITSHPDTDKLNLLTGVADGLNYLHSHDVIHGDLGGLRILVDDSGCPRITDFGIASLADADLSAHSEEPVWRFRSCKEWTAPEILDASGMPSKEGDVYSFAMIMIEVFTGRISTFPVSRYAELSAAGNWGLRFRRTVMDELFGLIESCWDKDPHKRPRMPTVLKTLRGLKRKQSRASTGLSAMTQSERRKTPETGLSGEGRPGSIPEVPLRKSPRNGTFADPNDGREGTFGGWSPDQNYGSEEILSESPPNGSGIHPLPPDIPPAPEGRHFRGELVNKILDLTDQVFSVALFGLVGVGKTHTATSLLHHHRTEAKFGQHRYFMSCSDLTNSLEDFLKRLSDVLVTDRTTSVAQLLSHIETLPPLILVLDGVDPILDPPAPESEEISAVIEELGGYENVCLVTTSRMHPDIQGFHSVEVPTLSEGDAREVFYSLCNLRRSPAVNELIGRLDAHPLSISHLATSVRKNNWDERMLLKAWDGGQKNLLQTSYYQCLKDAVEPTLRSPAITKLGTAARDALGEIAANPSGIEESKLTTEATGKDGTVDVLCKFSLVYRQGGLVRMLSPFQFYFLEFKPVPPQTADGEVNQVGGESKRAQAWRHTYVSGPRAGNNSSSRPAPPYIPPDKRHTVHEFNTPRSNGTQETTPHRSATLGALPKKWVKRLPQIVKRKLLAFIPRKSRDRGTSTPEEISSLGSPYEVVT